MPTSFRRDVSGVLSSTRDAVIFTIEFIARDVWTFVIIGGQPWHTRL
jgi:hypothetical protein